MTYRVSVSMGRRQANSHFSALHGLSLGSQPITPRNFNVMLSSLKFSSKAPAKRAPKAITVTKETSPASPQLWNCCNSGELLDEIVIVLEGQSDPTGENAPASVITLRTARISGYRPCASLQGYKPVSTHEAEQLQFSFQSIEFTNLSGFQSTSDAWSS